MLTPLKVLNALASQLTVDCCNDLRKKLCILRTLKFLKTFLIFLCGFACLGVNRAFQFHQNSVFHCASKVTYWREKSNK